MMKLSTFFLVSILMLAQLVHSIDFIANQSHDKDRLSFLDSDLFTNE